MAIIDQNVSTDKTGYFNETSGHFAASFPQNWVFLTKHWYIFQFIATKLGIFKETSGYFAVIFSLP